MLNAPIRAMKRQKQEQLEKEKLRSSIIREKEKASVKVGRVENQMDQMKRINQVLITSNDIKERIIGELKDELVDKSNENDKLRDSLRKKKEELGFYKRCLGDKIKRIFKGKYREYRNLSEGNRQFAIKEKI